MDYCGGMASSALYDNMEIKDVPIYGRMCTRILLGLLIMALGGNLWER